MKLAKQAYIGALILLMLVFSVPAQKSEKDPRNTAPTVGTGGQVGGPTGLFTVYDGSTLRKGEYTLSAAYSNYDRDPGNVDITSVPLSFQVGLTNRLELFFTTEAWRGIKVNAPRNLSGFYLPNSQVVGPGGTFVTAPALVLAPQGPGAANAALAGRAIFRPQGAPLGAFPYTGASLGTFGVNAPFFSGPLFGFGANTNAVISAPRAGGAADLFPGVGSVYGSILPGIVLSTVNLTTATGAPRGTAPVSFTTAPSYINDAPFINRTWGQTAFNSLDFGVKWRFNSTSSPYGVGMTAFYRWYLDTADDFAGFNQMQRGSGRGSKKGDIGVSLFGDVRPAKWLNVSGNVSYLYTSKIEGDFGGTDFTILDPGDELRFAVGVDFPVNKHFQPILEISSLHHVGGRTPNALEQDPVDGIAGFRVFPRRWFGFGLAYRHNFNQQDRDAFDDETTTANYIQTCGPLSATNCVPFTTSVNSTGIPSGFVTSSDPHGYIAQFWIGRRDKRLGEVINQAANVESVTLGSTTITLPCPPGRISRSGACGDVSRTISVATRAVDPENDVLTYNYTVSGGRIVGTGANVEWDLSTAQTGTYTITTGVDDGCGVCGRTNTQTITIRECPDCEAPAPTCVCATLSVSGPGGITQPGQSMNFTATAAGAAGSLTYNWTVTRGTITSGQGTPSITVSTTEADAGSNVTATVNIGGQDPACNCPTSASETGGVAARPEASTVDEFGQASNDDIKARVDNFYIQLNNNPSAQGYIINYGTPAQIRARRRALMAAITFRKYDVSRVTFVDGPDNGSLNTRFVLVPAGATPPTP